MGFSIGVFIPSDGGFVHGYAEDVLLSTSGIQVPALGVGLGNPGWLYDFSLNTNTFRINIERPLPSSVGTLTAVLKDLTTPATIATASISSGNTTGFIGFSTYSATSIQLAIEFSISGDTILLPRIQWIAHN